MLFGSHAILSALPIWASAFLLYMVAMGGIFVLRDRCEGLYYNTSYSAVIGDGALVVIVLMAAEMLKRGVPLPAFVQSGPYHGFSLVLGLAVGVSWILLDRPKQWGDFYHHIVIAPLLVYLASTLLPIIFEEGTKSEITATVALILIWAVLVVYDATTGRLDQRSFRNIGEHLDWIKLRM